MLESRPWSRFVIIERLNRLCRFTLCWFFSLLLYSWTIICILTDFSQNVCTFWYIIKKTLEQCFTCGNESFSYLLKEEWFIINNLNQLWYNSFIQSLSFQQFSPYQPCIFTPFLRWCVEGHLTQVLSKKTVYMVTYFFTF